MSEKGEGFDTLLFKSKKRAAIHITHFRHQKSFWFCVIERLLR